MCFSPQANVVMVGEFHYNSHESSWIQIQHVNFSELCKINPCLYIAVALIDFYNTFDWQQHLCAVIVNNKHIFLSTIRTTIIDSSIANTISEFHSFSDLLKAPRVRVSRIMFTIHSLLWSVVGFHLSYTIDKLYLFSVGMVYAFYLLTPSKNKFNFLCTGAHISLDMSAIQIFGLHPEYWSEFNHV